MNPIDLNRFGRASGRCKRRGFTLIELMIVVAVVAILAAVAVPAYQDFVRKARRSEAKDALLRLQIEEEKWRTNNSSYSGALSDLGLSSSTADGHYSIEITASSGTGYTATATGSGSQADDTGCTTLTLTVAAGAETKTPATCW